ncbi:MAG: hypothetical protein HY554_03775, partial [Elusimicrobia bacterium]|nr:hypothetical protein [Elusimicrobiota bacterium]
AYSLPRRIADLRGEMGRKIVQADAAAARVNEILETLEDATGARYGLRARKLPTGFRNGDPDTEQRLRALVDGPLQSLAETLKRVAADGQAEAGDGALSVGGDGGSIPTGDQPPPKIPEGQRHALLALEAIKRLVPTTATPEGDSLAEAVARYLFANEVVKGSEENLYERIPRFEDYLARGNQVLDEVFADLDLDESFVASGGGEGAKLYERKVNIYARIFAITVEGEALFKEKEGWSREGVDTVATVEDYYAKTGEIYDLSLEAVDAEEEAALEYKKTIDAMAKDFASQRAEVSGWLQQLNNPRETAMDRVSQTIDKIQRLTEGVLEANQGHHRARRELEAAELKLQEHLKDVEVGRARLRRELKDVRLEDLSPAVAARVEAQTLGGPAWLAADARGQALVIPKGKFDGFLSSFFGAVEPGSSSRDVARLREQLLSNPAALARLIPGSQMIDPGDDPDGFYLVYQSGFSTPGGLESESQVTLGNVLRLGETNVSLIGHRVGSPPSAGNAPFGDQGVTLQLESLGGERFVNTLDVTFHRFIQDIPKDMKIQSQANQSRLMLFDDFALMLAGDRLYIGAAGYADFALSDAKEKPYYLGGNGRATFKFNELLRLTAAQSRHFASDPRHFLQTVNLDFTKFDPSLDRDFVVSADGRQREFGRRKLGLELDLRNALSGSRNPWAQLAAKDSFQLDLFYSHVSGTDAITQGAAGVTVLKGFSFELPGKTQARITVSLTGEKGQQYDTGAARASFELPDQGIVLSAQGKVLGDAGTYFVEARKSLSAASSVSASYGSPYVGLNHRLRLGADSVFTLSELWRTVMRTAAEDAVGGKPLEGFKKDLDEFFARENEEGTVLAELQKAFANDVGARLIEQEFGALARELQELVNTGSFGDNMRLRGGIGIVSNPIGPNTADRAVGGGVQLGTQTDITLTKTQRGLVEQRTASLFAAGLRLQARLLERVKDWQETVGRLVQAQWELELARWSVAHEAEPVLQSRARARLLEVQGRLRQERLRYNLMTGRPPDAETMTAANPRDYDHLLKTLAELLSRSDRLGELLGRMDPARIPVPDPGFPGFNPIDHIPLVERFTAGVGVQLQDMLANQVQGFGFSVRIPLCDREGKPRDLAFRIERTAILEEMRAAYSEHRSRAWAENVDAKGLEAKIAWLAPESRESAQALGDALRRHRNGLARRETLWEAERRWHASMTGLLDARARYALALAWAFLDSRQARSGGGLSAGLETDDPGWGRAKDLASTLAQAAKVSPSLEALALRSQAAAELARAGGHRVGKWGVDVYVGTFLTADGVGWIPALGVTGFGVFPIPWAQLRPDELKALEVKRHSSESAAFAHLRDWLETDLAAQLVSHYADYRAARETLQIAERELLPAREREAASGRPEAARALAQARLEAEDARSRGAKALGALNLLLGRPPEADLDLAQAPEELARQLRELVERTRPVEAKRRAFAQRVETARAVETIVDKDLKVKELRLEPVSLIGQALGRILSAFSGSGDAGPEKVARARHQTLQAEQQQLAFERELPAGRSRLRFEWRLVRDALRGVEGSRVPEERIRAAELRRRRVTLQAGAAMLGIDLEADDDAGGSAALPGTFAELRNRLVEALQAKSATGGLGGELGEGAVQPPQVSAVGYLRYYNAIQSLGKDPIGKSFGEGWVEFRLRDPRTPPQALAALAQLETQRADQVHRAAAGRARAEAELLAARFAGRANLYRWALERSAPAAAALREELERDLSWIVAHLGLPARTRLEDVVALVPRDSAAEPGALAEQTRRELEDVDLAALRRILFEDGIPGDGAGAQHGLTQLKADLVARRMSYKGFTPVGAFGVFRGRPVGGVFLEAPEPKQVEKGLRAVLGDALTEELASRDHLKTLALKLHGLMASVADTLKLLEARQAALAEARAALSGAQVQALRGMGSWASVRAAVVEEGRADGEFLEALLRLRLDFVELTTELAALGHGSTPETPRRGPAGAPSSLPGAGPDALARLLDFWSERMLDAGFEERLGRFFDGAPVPPAEREALARELASWRRMKESSDVLRAHPGEPAEKLALLTHNDVEGRRLAVRRRLEGLLESLREQAPAAASGTPLPDPRWPAGPAARALWELLLADLGAQASEAKAEVASDRSLLEAMREAYWRADAVSPAAAAAYARLGALRRAVEERRDDLLAGYLELRERPRDFLLADVRLDAYLDAVTAYDSAVLEAFGDRRLSSDRANALVVNALFPLAQSAARRRDLLRHGRALLAARVLIEAESARLDALRFERAGLAETGPAAQRLAWLEGFRDRLTRGAETLPSVVAGVAADGAVKEWWTLEGLERKAKEGLVRLAEGASWVLPEGVWAPDGADRA